jgi:shikimate kinase
VLAGLYGGTFVDIDALITSRTGQSPRALYRKSPALFQKAEAEALGAALALSSVTVIIATGGGIIDNAAAWALLTSADITLVYLAVPATVAWQRISGGELPPFLDTDCPEETHRLLHERRAHAYQAIAHLVIAADHGSPEHIAAEIMETLRSG